MNSPERNRKLLRLKNFDYSSDGAYFITTCTKNREDYFGEINDGRMILNQRCYLKQERLVVRLPRYRSLRFMMTHHHL